MPDTKGALKIHQPIKNLFWNNLVGGIAWGLGSVIGATIVATILGLFFYYLGGTPIIGEWIARIKQATEEAYSSLPR